MCKTTNTSVVNHVHIHKVSLTSVYNIGPVGIYYKYASTWICIPSALLGSSKFSDASITSDKQWLLPNCILEHSTYKVK